MDDDDFLEFTEPARVLSPCVDVCTLDLDTGWCVGCGRTGDEIGEWSAATDTRRQTIVDALPARMEQLCG